MWPASGDFIYIYKTRSRKFSKSGVKTKRRRQAAKFSHRAAPSPPTSATPPTTLPSSRRAWPTSTSAPPSSARAPPLLPVDHRRLPLGRRPFSHGPSPHRRPRAPRRPTTYSQDDVLLPTGRFPNRRPGTAADCSADSTSADSSAPPLATDTSSPHRSARMEAGDGAGTATTTAPAWFVFFSLFSKCNYMC
jgi:hypothetical protein